MPLTELKIKNPAVRLNTIADANGNAATIEFLKGKMVVHKGSSLPYSVLTNSIYEESVKTIDKAKARKDSLQFTDNSLQRFSTACRLVKQLEQTIINTPLVDYSFDILKQVAQKGFTKWSIVYDITNKKIHFKTADYQELKTIDMKHFDLSCAARAVSFNMNQNAKGDISKQFQAYSNELNKNKLQEAFTNSKSQITISEATQNAIAQLAMNVKCNVQ